MLTKCNLIKLKCSLCKGTGLRQSFSITFACQNCCGKRYEFWCEYCQNSHNLNISASPRIAQVNQRKNSDAFFVKTERSSLSKIASGFFHPITITLSQKTMDELGWDEWTGSDININFCIYDEEGNRIKTLGKTISISEASLKLAELNKK